MIFDPEQGRTDRPSDADLLPAAAGAWWMAHMPVEMTARWLGLCADDAGIMQVRAVEDLRRIKAMSDQTNEVTHG